MQNFLASTVKVAMVFSSGQSIGPYLNVHDPYVMVVGVYKQERKHIMLTAFVQLLLN